MLIIKEIEPEAVWPIRQRVMWPEKPLEFVKIEDDNKGMHYGLYKDEKLTSVISCFEKAGEMQFRKFATLTEEQGRGLGTYLLNYIMEIAKRKGARRIWCNARMDKIKFYEKFGLKVTNEKFNKDGIAFIIMEYLYLN